MHIAQVAPLFESVPPRLYGGTERVVADLTDELVRQGHTVTLFASGDSGTSARLVAACPRALRLSRDCRNHTVPHVLMLEQVAQRADDFDVIHFHIGELHFPLIRRLTAAQLTTLHGRLDLAELVPVYREFSDMPLVSISDAQRTPLSYAKWIGTVHHGVVPERFRFHPEPGGYFAFLGRISPEKRVDRAVAIAKACRIRLRIAAKVDEVDAEYFHKEVVPLLDQPGVEFVGEIGEAQKSEFLGHAKALLFPIDWPEPFGLVMIEALACGTPVIAFRHGSVPEVLEHGVTGFIVDDLEQAIEAAARIDQIDRARCRHTFNRRFTAARMAGDYVELYRSVAQAAVPGLVAQEAWRA